MNGISNNEILSCIGVHIKNISKQATLYIPSKEEILY